MRTAKIVALALGAAIAASAAPAEKIAFTKPLWDRPADIEKFAQTWPDAPALSEPSLQMNAAPEAFVPADAQEAPREENHLHRGPTSEEWHCLVPLQEAAPPPESTAPNRCQTPSLEPHQLFHLL